VDWETENEVSFPDERVLKDCAGGDVARGEKLWAVVLWTSKVKLLRANVVGCVCGCKLGMTSRPLESHI
jgi:hypothetical protein